MGVLYVREGKKNLHSHLAGNNADHEKKAYLSLNHVGINAEVWLRSHLSRGGV